MSQLYFPFINTIEKTIPEREEYRCDRPQLKDPIVFYLIKDELIEMFINCFEEFTENDYDDLVRKIKNDNIELNDTYTFCKWFEEYLSVEINDSIYSDMESIIAKINNSYSDCVREWGVQNKIQMLYHIDDKIKFFPMRYDYKSKRDITDENKVYEGIILNLYPNQFKYFVHCDKLHIRSNKQGCYVNCENVIGEKYDSK